MFEYSKRLMEKIRNGDSLDKREIMTVERCLRLYEISEQMLNYQIGVSENNNYELTEQICSKDLLEVIRMNINELRECLFEVKEHNAEITFNELMILWDIWENYQETTNKIEMIYNRELPDDTLEELINYRNCCLNVIRNFGKQ